MKRWYLRFLKWYGAPSENDEYLDDWLQFSTWRVYFLGLATTLIPALLLFEWLGLV